MTPELEEYTQGLHIYAYRMIDGSLVLAEEIECDETEGLADDELVIARPLQVVRAMSETGGVSPILIPWTIGETDHLHMSMFNVLVRSTATLAEKTSYCQFFLINTLKGAMGAEELSKLMDETESPKPKKKVSGSNKPIDLAAKLKHNKRFDLN